MWPSGTTPWACPQEPPGPALQESAGLPGEGGWTLQQTPGCLRPALPGGAGGGGTWAAPPRASCTHPAVCGLRGCPGLPAPSSPLPGGGWGPWDPRLSAGGSAEFSRFFHGPASLQPPPSGNLISSLFSEQEGDSALLLGPNLSTAPRCPSARSWGKAGLGKEQVGWDSRSSGLQLGPPGGQTVRPPARWLPWPRPGLWGQDALGVRIHPECSFPCRGRAQPRSCWKLQTKVTMVTLLIRHRPETPWGLCLGYLGCQAGCPSVLAGASPESSQGWEEARRAPLPLSPSALPLLQPLLPPNQACAGWGWGGGG